MVTGFILPAIAAFLLFVSFKTVDGFDLVKFGGTAWFVLALVLFRTLAWASALSFVMFLLLIVGLIVLIAYARLFE